MVYPVWNNILGSSKTSSVILDLCWHMTLSSLDTLDGSHSLGDRPRILQGHISSKCLDLLHTTRAFVGF